MLIFLRASVRLLLALLLLPLVMLPAHADDGGAASTATWLVFAVPVTIVVLLAIAWGAARLAGYFRGRAALAAAADRERDYNMRVARVMDTVSSVANGIAEKLLQHPPAPADTIAAVRGALLSEGVAYVQDHHPEDVPLIRLATETLTARLDNTVAGKLLTGSLPLPSALPAEAAPAVASALG